MTVTDNNYHFRFAALSFHESRTIQRRKITDWGLVRRTRQGNRALTEFRNAEINVNLIEPSPKSIVTFGNFLKEHRIKSVTINQL